MSWINRVFHRLSSTTVRLILVMAGFLVLWGMLAPVTTILWWLNQTAASLGFEAKENEKPDVLQPQALAQDDSLATNINCYLVFLPGVGNFSPNEIAEGEEYFIDQLASRHDNCVAVKDVFPYSVNNRDLSDQNVLTPLWEAAKDSDRFPGQVFIQIRNLWRFAISADDRYGPVYNLSVARTIVERMHMAHPIVRSDQPVNLVLVSTSGGTQVALGASDHLHDWLDEARITVVSIGGAFEGREGFNQASHVYHFYGDRDWVTDLPHVLFPARWPFVVGSPVNQAQRENRYTVCNSGDSEHTGEEGYFGEAIAYNNTSYLEQTLAEVAQLPIWSLDQPLISICPTQR
ncbi:MAG: hypothetical protein AAF716_19355 [Cyanobacteria bacterium P01_D01_bin.1]